MNEETAKTAQYLRRALNKLPKFPTLPLEVEVAILSALVVAFGYGVLYYVYA
jgi:hypothetical protein